MSPEVFPSPRPLSGSLLTIELIRHTTADTVSVDCAVTFTAIIWWFAGPRTFGDADRTGTEGAVVSCTITVNDAVATFPARSLAVHVTVVVPRGNVVPDG